MGLQFRFLRERRVRRRAIAAVLVPVVTVAGIAVATGHSDAATVSYASTVLADNPAAYLRLDDAGATAADSAGHGRNGTIAADAVHLASGAPANETNGALRTGGTNPALTLPADGLPGRPARRPWRCGFWDSRRTSRAAVPPRT